MNLNDPIAIRVRGIVNRFGAQTVHDGVNLDVRNGEILGVVGGSGTGKSVLMRSIIGLKNPEAGEVEIFGESMLNREEDEALAIRKDGYTKPVYNATLPSVTLLLFGLICISPIAAAVAGEIAASFMRRGRVIS